MGKWEPIETAPKDGTRVLVNIAPCNFGDDYGYVWAMKWCGEYQMWSMPGISGFTATHWMPLPGQPPVSASAQGSGR